MDRRNNEKRHKTQLEDAVYTTGETLTPEQVKLLKTTFKRIDQNHDGRISYTDLRRGIKQLGILLTRDEVHEMLSEADDDGSGFVEYPEFERLVGPQLVISNYKNKLLKEKFKVFDKDGDGFITGDEIRAVFIESGVDFTEQEITELVEEADENGDGVISFEEFVSTVCEKDW